MAMFIVSEKHLRHQKQKNGHTLRNPKHVRNWDSGIKIACPQNSVAFGSISRLENSVAKCGSISRLEYSVAKFDSISRLEFKHTRRHFYWGRSRGIKTVYKHNLWESARKPIYITLAGARKLVNKKWLIFSFVQLGKEKCRKLEIQHVFTSIIKPGSILIFVAFLSKPALLIFLDFVTEKKRLSGLAWNESLSRINI